MIISENEKVMYSQNIDHIFNLKPTLQKNALDCHNAWWGVGHRMKIFDSIRTEEEQLKRFVSGRSKETLEQLFKYKLFDQITFDKLLALWSFSAEREEVKTWSIHSPHTEGIALDIKPMNCSYVDLKKIGEQFGLIQTIPEELWHFECSEKKCPPFVSRFLYLFQ